MVPPREVELKLELPSEALAGLARSAVLQAARKRASKPVTLVSVYFDTDKLKLRRKGVTLRVRRIGRRHVQTIKQQSDERTALFSRNEWEHDVAGPAPDFDAASETAVAPWLTEKLRRGLKPVFETHVRRIVYPVRSGASEIALAVDTGTIQAGLKSLAFCELELELKSGEPAALYRLARTLGEEFPVQLAVKSKSERGYALLTGEKPAILKAAPVALTPQSNRLAAFQAIARACLYQLIANRPAMQSGNPDGVHQMRVSLRRLRAAISLFSDMLTDPQTEAIRAELKWITGELAPARELDVFMQRVVKPVTSDKPHAPGVAVLGKDLRRRRDDALVRARAAIESSRFRLLVLDIAAWIEAGQWTRSADDLLVSALTAQPIAVAGADELHKRRKKILKKGKGLDALDPQRRHKLRIQAKKLRYASEFFAGAFDGKKAAQRRKTFIARLEKLQDALGDLNDIATHEGLAERLIDGLDFSGQRRKGRAKKAFAAGRLSGREEARIASVIKEAERAYGAFIKAKPFWLRSKPASDKQA